VGRRPGHLLNLGELPAPSPKNPRWVFAATLLQDAKSHSLRNKYTTPHELGHFLREMGCEQKSNGKNWGWIFPPLPEARSKWAARASKTWQWDTDIEDWGEKPAVGEE